MVVPETLGEIRRHIDVPGIEPGRGERFVEGIEKVGAWVWQFSFRFDKLVLALLFGVVIAALIVFGEASSLLVDVREMPVRPYSAEHVETLEYIHLVSGFIWTACIAAFFAVAGFAAHVRDHEKRAEKDIEAHQRTVSELDSQISALRQEMEERERRHNMQIMELTTAPDRYTYRWPVSDGLPSAPKVPKPEPVVEPIRRVIDID